MKIYFPKHVEGVIQDTIKLRAVDQSTIQFLTLWAKGQST